MTIYATRPIAWIVGPSDKPLYDDQMTRIEIEDQSAGEYVVVSQAANERGDHRIAIGAEEWPAIRAAVDAALAECIDFGGQS